MGWVVESYLVVLFACELNKEAL